MAFLIDDLAGRNQWSTYHPVEKSVFAIATLLTCLASRTLFVPLLIITVMSSLLLLRGGVSPRVYRNLMLIPMSFILIGILPILIQVGGHGEGWTIGRIGGFRLWIAREGFYQGILVCIRSLGCVCCMYFLLLTTPMTELLSLLRRCGIPPLFCEMALFIYRFIFLLWDSAESIYRAQTARGGYRTLRHSFVCMAELLTNVLGKALYRGQGSYRALLSRGYEGEIRVLEGEYGFSRRNWWIICLWECLLLWMIIRGGG